MKNVKRAISLTLAASILFAVCSCDESDNASAEGSLNLKWLDSSLFENVDQMAGAAIKDDFAAAVNYEWASIMICSSEVMLLPGEALTQRLPRWMQLKMTSILFFI